MRTYEVFLINEEVAYIYYGFESKLFHLFKEHQQATKPLKEITGRQVHYILKPFDHKDLNEWLHDKLKDNKSYSSSLFYHALQFNDKKSQATIEVKADRLVIQSSGTFEAEMLLFDTLKKYDDFFLAVDYDREKYGWLRPLKSLRIVEQG
ncbi:sporulation inhibitor of replication protein SirA [Alteribacter aurantiacus]|uniref:sporulation inhibitor of replication protein SirA n=1 Tax=Alteribacter aurantiacus TaxID=254410 RepID=UPI00040422FC|nr:sporulation inhibitor of replication protein SirA [Alteribacter aurantiacus]